MTKHKILGTGISSLFGKIPNEIHLFTILISGKALTSAAVFEKLAHVTIDTSFIYSEFVDGVFIS